MNKILIWTMMLCSLLLTGCDKLDDSDDGMVKEILPGHWAFSYVIQSEEDPGLEFNYKQVIFNEDGTYECWWGIDTLPKLNKYYKN